MVSERCNVVRFSSTFVPSKQTIQHRKILFSNIIKFSPKCIDVPPIGRKGQRFLAAELRKAPERRQYPSSQLYEHEIDSWFLEDGKGETNSRPFAIHYREREIPRNSLQPTPLR